MFHKRIYQRIYFRDRREYCHEFINQKQNFASVLTSTVHQTVKMVPSNYNRTYTFQYDTHEMNTHLFGKIAFDVIV